MLEFKYPANILFLLVALVAVVFFVLAFSKKEKIMAVLHLGRKVRFKALRSLLLSLGLGLMVMALLGPQVFSGYSEVNKSGLDIYILMDTSKSMLVTDISPDRMTVAKKIAADLVARLKGDRIGFIPFASAAYIQMPLTDDYQLARMFLDVMDTDMIGGGGTNLAAAIKLAAESFSKTAEGERVILVISDGEDHDEASLKTVKGLAEEQIRIFTVGVGSEKGGLVPVYDNSGDTVIDYLKDENGNPVNSRLMPATLKQLALAGNGAYYQASLQGMETSALLNDLSALKKDTFAAEQIKRYRPLFQYFLGTGLFLFLLAWLWPERGKI
ncbi:MAG: VWA domain-containing protein [Clostridiales bacterium]|nr:VWA domain-containing protein [Clostridiales bacterium]